MHMDNEKIIIYYTILFIAMLAAMFIAGRYIRKLQPKTIKRINKISFSLAVASGILQYIFKKPIFMYLLGAFIVSFFMFYNYKEKA